VEGWTFVYMFVVLKIPVIAALWLVWWAVRSEPATDEDPAVDGGGGGGSPHPRLPRPRRPGRGEHGRPTPRAPRRTRARGRSLTPAAER
jgi:hypothetical protein